MLAADRKTFHFILFYLYLWWWNIYDGKEKYARRIWLSYFLAILFRLLRLHLPAVFGNKLSAGIICSGLESSVFSYALRSYLLPAGNEFAIFFLASHLLSRSYSTLFANVSDGLIYKKLLDFSAFKQKKYIFDTIQSLSSVYCVCVCAYGIECVHSQNGNVCR